MRVHRTGVELCFRGHVGNVIASEACPVTLLCGHAIVTRALGHLDLIWTQVQNISELGLAKTGNLVELCYRHVDL